MTGKAYKILSINPGMTSTKIAVYENEKELFRKSVTHDATGLKRYRSIIDQLPLRRDAIMNCLREANLSLDELSAVASRGGRLPPLKQGAYRITKDMVNFLTYRPIDHHAQNLGAIIGYDLSQRLDIPAYIYDATVVDEFTEVARLSGCPEIPRRASSHFLNLRAGAIKTAKRLNRNWQEMNIVAVHLGSGISMAIFSGGQEIDVINNEESPYTPERAGRVPCLRLVDLCFSGQYDHETVAQFFLSTGALAAYLGTGNVLEVEERIRNGDKYAELVFYGMAYQIAKGIGELATVVDGAVDVIILTGAIANSKMMTDWVSKKVKFIAPVEIIPGENELESLALGVLRVLRGEEEAREFVSPA